MPQPLRVHTATLRFRGFSYTVELRFEDDAGFVEVTPPVPGPLPVAETPQNPDIRSGQENAGRAESPEISPVVPPVPEHPADTGAGGTSRSIPASQKKSTLPSASFPPVSSEIPRDSTLNRRRRLRTPPADDTPDHR